MDGLAADTRRRTGARDATGAHSAHTRLGRGDCPGDNRPRCSRTLVAPYPYDEMAIWRG